jgi:hypothetical protein
MAFHTFEVLGTLSSGLSVIAGRVFIDHDQDGRLERLNGDSPMQGIAIQLEGTTNAGQSVVATILTDADGSYEFAVEPGTYEIEEAVFDFGREFVGSVFGGSVTAEGGTAIRDVVVPGPGLRGDGYDFTQLGQSQIAGRAFIDRDQDGQFEPNDGDLPLELVEIEIRGDESANSQIVETATTAADGSYLLPPVPLGRYTVQQDFIPEAFDGADFPGTRFGGSALSTLGLSSDAIFDVSVDQGGTVAAGYDFTEQSTSRIEGRVYLDTDGDGIFDPSAGDAPLANIEIRIDPVAKDDSLDAVEDGPGVTVNVLDNDQDAAGILDPLVVAGVDATGTRGLVTFTDSTVSFDPNARFESLDVGDVAFETFTYTVEDGDGGSAIPWSLWSFLISCSANTTMYLSMPWSSARRATRCRSPNTCREICPRTLELLEQNVERYLALAEAFPDQQIDYWNRAGVAWNMIFTVQQERGNDPEATRAVEQALQVYRRVEQARPDWIFNQIVIAESEGNLANLLIRAGVMGAGGSEFSRRRESDAARCRAAARERSRCTRT